MESPELRVLAITGTMGNRSAVRTTINQLGKMLSEKGCSVDYLDLGTEEIGLFNPETSYGSPYYGRLKCRVVSADVLILGSPDYHGSISGILKNFLDHFWKEYAGKLAVPLVCSYDKGLTVSDHLRTMMRQTYTWVLPYAITFAEGADVKDGQVVSDALKKRLEMSAQDIFVYGQLLANQRRTDLLASTPGFLAMHRPKTAATEVH